MSQTRSDDMPLPIAFTGSGSSDGGVVDLKGALARMGGDQKLLTLMTRFFLADMPGLIAEMNRGLREKNTTAIENAAHSLKGLAANFGAKPAMEAACRLETIGRSGDLAAAGDAFKILEREMLRLRQALAASTR